MARAKGKVREAVRDMAKDLLTLYAARETMQGHSFGKDTVWQRELKTLSHTRRPGPAARNRRNQGGHGAVETDGPPALRDVGYGKTEVALRVAFKAVTDGKQVAMLAPTTILAQQHYTTFLDRMAAYPVTVEVLSRFRTPREQRQVLLGLERGTVDVVIGTHRLLQEDVHFKDLGLLIIDEEQRFGVAHKES